MPDIRQINQTLKSEQTIIVDPNLLINRGLYCCKPKKINLNKAAATLIRQVARRSPEYVSDAFLIEPEADFGSIHSTLKDFENLTVTNHSVSSFIRHLQGSKNRSVWAACGPSSSYSDQAHDSFAQSLLSYKNSWQQDFLSELTERQKILLAQKQDFFAKRMENLCVEVKPGKNVLLDIWEPSLLEMQKKWRPIISGKKTKPEQLFAPVEKGFGFGAIVAGLENEKSGRKIEWSTLNLEFQNESFDLNTSQSLFNEINKWLPGLGVDSIGSLESVYLSIPSMVIAYHLRAEWVESCDNKLAKEVFKFHDLIWGWHPVLTLMQLFARAKAPALFVHTGQFPKVDIVLIKEVES
jgi:hypothetical protein